MRLSELWASWRDRVGVQRRAGHRPRPTAARLRVERLEEREVPATNVNQAFVSTLYQGLLGRTPDLLALSFWSGQLSSGATPVQVASGIVASGEYRTHEVVSLYQSLLGRTPDTGGLTFFVDALLNGASLDQVRATILASDEFFTHAGNNPQGFLDALYQDVLGRAVDPIAQSVFGAASAGGSGARMQVADQVLGSSEAQLDKLQFDYQTLLGRPLDAGGAAFWGTALLNGAREESVLAGLLGSSEYLSRLQNVVAAASDPLQAATAFIAANNLFQIVNTSANPGAHVVTAAGTLAPVNLPEAPSVGSVVLPIGFSLNFPGATVGLFGPNGFVPISQLSQTSLTGSGVNTGSSTGANAVQPGTAGTNGTFVSPLVTGSMTSPLINSPFTSPLVNLPLTSPLTTGTFTSPLTTGTFGSPLITGTFGTL
jgi:hypothetical protein